MKNSILPVALLLVGILLGITFSNWQRGSQPYVATVIYPDSEWKPPDNAVEKHETLVHWCCAQHGGGYTRYNEKGEERCVWPKFPGQDVLDSFNACSDPAGPQL